MVESLVHPYSGLEAKAKEPINQDLMDLKVKENIEGLLASINNISTGGGVGDTGAVGSMLSGGETNDARFWKRRFHPLQHMLNADSKNPNGFDPEGSSLKNELLTFIQSNDSGLSVISNSVTYLGQYLRLDKDSKIHAKIKKGVNFFSIGSRTYSSASNRIEFLIDGQTPSALGLVDENGDAAPDFISAQTASSFAQDTTFFYGLDGEEHTIEILNNDSTTLDFDLEFIEVGFRSENPTINEQLKINTGKASVRGAEVEFAETEVTFGKTELNGHTGSIVVDADGLVTSLDGEAPAMTQVKPEEAIAFSAAVTTIPVKNNFYFPENGICLFSTPYGNHYLFSYGAKTDTNIQSHSFDSMLWQSQPTEDFTPLSGFTSVTAGDAFGDLNINYYGTAPILIDSTNNKLDFSITIGGVTTIHAATITNGRYSADLVPLEAAVRKAMQIAKPINGEYHLKYNADTQLWTIWVSGNEIEAFSVLFSTGVNSANSIHTTIGFASTDGTGALSYLANTEVQHLCCRVLEKDSTYMHSEDPRIKFSTTNTNTSDSNVVDIENRLGIGSVRALGGNGAFMLQIFPDNDCSGLELTFVRNSTSSMLTYQIDDGQCLYLTQTDTTIGNSSVRGSLLSGFISFPRGSRKITVRVETTVPFKIGTSDNDTRIYFAGARQYFTKPAYEKLTLTQSVIKTVDISPISLYATIYGHNGGTLYSPAAQDDNINTITEVGSWTSNSLPTSFNASSRNTNVNGDYVEIDFTLVGSGGGIALKGFFASADTSKVGVFISTSAIVEGTDRVANTHFKWATTHYDQDCIGVFGLPSGAYKARFKNEQAAVFRTTGIVIYDTVTPQENTNTVTDVNNTGQSISYPINVIREVIQQDSDDRVPSFLQRSGYKEGRTTLVNYSLNSPSFLNHDDVSSLILDSGLYYGLNMRENISGVEINIATFCKSISLLQATINSFSTNSKMEIDGTQVLNSHSSRVQVKGGSSPSVTRFSTSRLVSKLFNLTCSHNSGLIFDLNDTRGLKLDQEVILDDGVNKEKAVIDSFVVGVSFTIKKALITVVAANVTGVEYQGFHNYNFVANDGVEIDLSCFEFEPLKISPSKALQRRSVTFEYEKVTRTFRGISDNQDAYYPTHSDGVVGNWNTSTIEVIGTSSASTYNFSQDLKNISVGAGTIDFKITSERLVPVLDEKERF